MQLPALDLIASTSCVAAFDMWEAVEGVGGRDSIENELHHVPQSIHGVARQAAQQLLDLREEHVDQIE